MVQRQVSLFGETETVPITSPDIQSYDHILVAFSGGKDSLACLLHLLELGCRVHASSFGITVLMGQKAH
ncbi:hypothetical protein GGI1_00690 [Acidithiobacillus sp. GGI-221]|nr:hypothetical protein GGI1_00690 [Acidithiobacillus sp. GGI-221]